MSTATTNLGLKKAVNSDNANTYLVTDLAASLDTLDGHHHGTDANGLAVRRIRSGVIGSRPAAGTAGAVYVATDTDTLYFDDGVAWIDLFTFLKETARTIKIADTTSANTSGGALSVLGGAALGSGTGGSLTLAAGAAGLTGPGGLLNLSASDGGATSGQGGNAALVAGNALSGNSAGGTLNLAAGTGRGTQAGGSGLISGGANSGGSGSGGSVGILAGAGGVTNGQGGPVTIVGGAAGGGNANGGRIILTTGAKAGTGLKPPVEIDGLFSSPPTAATLGSGFIGLRYNLGGGTLVAYVNDGGTIRSISLGTPV